MKASYLVSYGQPGSLQYGEMPEPVLQKNSILVQVKAVSVNPVDWKIRQGVLKLIQGSKFPRIIGSDFAGIVKEVAPGIAGFKAGDRVYGAIPAFSNKPGALAELANVPQKDIHRLLRPDGVYSSPLYMPWTIFRAIWVRIWYGRKITSSNMRKRPGDYDELEALMEQNKLKPVIENKFPLEKSSEAFDKAEFGKPRGKVIIYKI
jgi:NADPH:quinone reductase-like Zn-dependent oxidoreductase